VCSTALSVGPIRQLLIQSTSFCNIDCRYCYLASSERSKKNDVSLATATRALEFAAESGTCLDRLEIRWHSGEPLARGLDFYEAAYGAAESILGGDRFWFSIQTNGLLIDDRWCDFFARRGVEVGVSLDGPREAHDRRRVDRRGRGTFDLVMRGIDRLHSRGVEFDVICVLGEETLADPDGTFRFFTDLGCREVGFNTDDRLTTEASEIANYRRFMARMAESSQGGKLRIRELDHARRAILSAELPIGNALTEPLAILNVDAEGNWTTFSPEFLTLDRDGTRPYVLGNVHCDRWSDVPASPRLKTLSDAVAAGVERCRVSCPYFPVCGGGSPAAKAYENGSLDSTATAYCRTRIQAVTDLVLDRMEAAASGRE
jgi:uncharacterized protein